MEALQCEDISCTKHRKDIDDFYYSITNCLQGCVKQCNIKLKYIMRILLQVGMNMLVITIVCRAQILSGGCHVIDHATGLFTMP